MTLRSPWLINPAASESASTSRQACLHCIALHQVCSESEAELHAEVKHMLQAAQGRRPFSGGQSVGGSPMPKEVPGSKPGTAQSQRSNFSADGMQLVAAEYVLDFGYVIKGMQKVAMLCLAMPFMQGQQRPFLQHGICSVACLGSGAQVQGNQHRKCGREFCAGHQDNGESRLLCVS